MKAAPFRYHAPRSVAEALDLLGSLENSRPLAGGQSLMPILNLRLAAPDDLIDLNRIPELAGIEEGGTDISMGAMTTQRSAERSAVMRRLCPLLAEAVDHVGHQQTRNRGTIGGSLCHLDPGAELPVAALALDAELTIAGPGGVRKLPFHEFPAGYLNVTLEPGEILTRISVPKVVDREGAAFLEFNRRPADFAIVSVAARLVLDAGGHVARAAIAVGGVHYTPIRLTVAEDAMLGQMVGADLFAAAGEIAAAIDCDGDDLYPADFRRELCGVLVRRALKKAAARAEGQTDV